MRVPSPLVDLWVPDRAATFATAGERPWKSVLYERILQAAGRTGNGVSLVFCTDAPASGHHAPDIDNLCEPVLSVLVNAKGWCGGRRSLIRWLAAHKFYTRSASVLGCHIRVFDCNPPLLPDFTGPILYRACGVLPQGKGEADAIHWVKGNPEVAPVAPGKRLAVHVEFGGDTVNLGDVATGRVKSLIDCLWPVLGGTRRAPADWRIDFLQLEKGVAGLGVSGVRVTVRRIEAPSGTP